MLSVSLIRMPDMPIFVGHLDCVTGLKRYLSRRFRNRDSDLLTSDLCTMKVSFHKSMNGRTKEHYCLLYIHEIRKVNADRGFKTHFPNMRADCVVLSNTSSMYCTHSSCNGRNDWYLPKCPPNSINIPVQPIITQTIFAKPPTCKPFYQPSKPPSPFSP